ncbi:hypothetical protein L1987_66192 [Smallanthus sonchifolius]|uniref:Uncharacterized protein n=1 Tax=Smallanthus sonchifolius TaxID=185202 RepID=A0ACB9BWL3_9ASTR|nr:hypothetical protein L1987_66192 [Smallanthus sonchifolius]
MCREKFGLLEAGLAREPPRRAVGRLDLSIADDILLPSTNATFVIGYGCIHPNIYKPSDFVDDKTVSNIRLLLLLLQEKCSAIELFSPEPLVKK